MNKLQAIRCVGNICCYFLATRIMREKISFKKTIDAAMEYQLGSWNSCNCLHGTVGGFTRPLERVLSEFLKLYIMLQLTGTAATAARIRYTEACTDSRSAVSSVKISTVYDFTRLLSHRTKMYLPYKFSTIGRSTKYYFQIDVHKSEVIQMMKFLLITDRFSWFNK